MFFFFRYTLLHHTVIIIVVVLQSVYLNMHFPSPEKSLLNRGTKKQVEDAKQGENL